MQNSNPFEELVRQVEERGWYYGYLTSFLRGAGNSQEEQRKRLNFELPTQIYFSIDDPARLQNIKDGMKLFPYLKPDMTKIIHNIKRYKLFKKLADDKTKKLASLINELNACMQE